MPRRVIYLPPCVQGKHSDFIWDEQEPKKSFASRNRNRKQACVQMGEASSNQESVALRPFGHDSGDHRSGARRTFKNRQKVRAGRRLSSGNVAATFEFREE